MALITLRDINELARPCYADEDLVVRCIEEAEMLDIRSSLGDKLFIRIRGNGGDTTLLNGGEWNDSKGDPHLFSGLKATIAYYAYSRIVKAGSGVQTRFGFVEKRDDNSERSDLKDRIQASNEAKSIADEMLKEVVRYLQDNRERYPELPCKVVVRSKGLRIRKIGV